MKLKRLSEMPQFEREIIKMIWDDAQGMLNPHVWHNYERNFFYEKQPYKVKCTFKIENGFFTHKDLVISHDTYTIDLMKNGFH